MTKEICDEVLEAFAEKKKMHQPKDHGVLLDSGSTLLNLACTDTARGAFGIGRMVNIVGDKSSGKSFLAMTALAEACNRAEFEEYRLVYDDAEFALGFDVEKLFGKKLAKELNVRNSQTIEEFAANCLRELKSKTPCIYVIDSMDSLSSNEEAELSAAMVKASEQDKPIDASKGYKLAKARILSSSLRQICAELKHSRSILIIISQVRENLEFGFEKYTITGGKSLQFYASHQIWLFKKGKLQRTVNGKKRSIGVVVDPKVRKNKLTGKEREDIPFAIYYDYGVDDIGSMIDWMVSEKVWKKAGSNISTNGDLDLPESVDREALITLIEEDDALYEDLRDYVAEKWLEIEEKIKTNRRSKYQ